MCSTRTIGHLLRLLGKRGVTCRVAQRHSSVYSLLRLVQHDLSHGGWRISDRGFRRWSGRRIFQCPSDDANQDKRDRDERNPGIVRYEQQSSHEDEDRCTQQKRPHTWVRKLNMMCCFHFLCFLLIHRLGYMHVDTLQRRFHIHSQAYFTIIIPTILGWYLQT